VLSAAFVAALLLAAPAANAGIFVLNDAGLNSSVTIDTTSQSGISSWEVDGVDHLFQQWFWYRVGMVDAEQSIDTLVPGGIEQSLNTNFALGDDLFVAQYPDTLGNFVMEVRISLQAGMPGSNTSSLSQQISITNTSNAVLPFRFFMFSDFDMNGTVDFDSVVITGNNTANQTDNASIVTSQVVATPTPTRVQADDRNNLLTLLNNATPTTLDNTANYSGSDTAWAFQWNHNIPVGGTFIVSNSQSIQAVPEPASIGVALLGGAGLVFFARRMRRRARD